MDTSSEDRNRHGELFSRAPLGRRIGAHLLDSCFALLVIYLGTLPLVFAYEHGFGDLYLAIYHSFVIGWVVLKDSWWPGQSLGKRIARILIAAGKMGGPASRLQCVKRQAIFILLVGMIYFPAYLYISGDPIFLRQAFLSTLLSVVAPIRLLAFLFPSYATSGGSIFVAHMLVLGFVLVEGFLVYRRPDGRRIIDLLAGVQVVGDRGTRAS
jgi:uncharacterized RDD family membrane protein YckC